MRLNGLGVAMYLLMTGWLLLAAAVRLMIEIGSGSVDWLPFIGIALGLLALAGIGFGRVTDTDSGGDRRHASSGSNRSTVDQRR